MSDITIQELLKGKPTIIKNREFYPTKTYVEPFLERMSAFTDDFSIQVKLPDQMTLENGNEDITFNRVLIQAKMPAKFTVDSHDEVIGFLYGLDVRKPVVKIYRGHLNQACTNLCVFNPEWINVQELIPGEPINFAAIKNLMESTSNFAVTLEKMKREYLDRNERKRFLGQWVDYALRENENYGFGNVKISVSTPIDAYKSLFIKEDSEYYIPQGYDPTLYDIYNAFTQIITNDKKDLMNKFEKTMIINRLLEL